MRIYAGRLDCLVKDDRPARQSKKSISATMQLMAKDAKEVKGDVRRKR